MDTTNALTDTTDQTSTEPMTSAPPEATAANPAPASGPAPGSRLIGTYVIARSSQSGCWAGTLTQINGDTVELIDARRLWRWWAAAGVSLSGVAAHGLHPGKQSECRIAAPVAIAMVLGVCEVIAVSDAARASIVEAPQNAI